MNSARRLFAFALLLDIVGAGAALLISSRPWQSVTVDRPRPLADVTLQITGRRLDGALLGATLVALAGVVAVLATKAVSRRVVGVLIALSGGLLCWRAATGDRAVSHPRALDLVTASKGSVGITASSVTHVVTHPVWPALTVLSAVLVMAAGVLVCAFGSGWSAMSSRYEAPNARPVGGDEAMWTALDRGVDPTTRTES